MKFYFFHLLPYSHLDLDYDLEHESPWVTLPNSYYDPVLGHELYDRYLGELELADELGYDGICVNEHHQTAYGMMPAPNILAGALSRRTKKSKIGILGRALPLVNNPITIAEEFAMLDNVTAGRIITGFVRGIGCEYHAWGANPGESHDRFHEAHDLIVRAWTETGPFSFHGKHYHFEYVNLWPRPYQNPHPPIWIPSQGSRETIEWAAHPDRKYTYLQTFSPIASVEKYLKQYLEIAKRHGYQATGDQLGWAVPLYVAETDEQARDEAAIHIENFFNKFLKTPMEYKMPPGYTSMASAKAIIASKFKIREQVLTFGKLMDEGMFVCGSPETVIETLKTRQKALGFEHLISMLQFGTLPADLTERNLRLFADRIIPALKDSPGVGLTGVAAGAEPAPVSGAE